MKQFLATIILSSLGFAAFAQKSAEDGSFEFVTKKDDGNGKFIKYTALNFGYSPFTYTIDDGAESYLKQTKAYSFGIELYNTFRKKMAGSQHYNIGVFDKNYFFSLDYGIYFLIVKGLFIKPRAGYGIMYDDVTSLAPQILTYGGDLGYIFKVSSSQSRKPVFIGISGGYTGVSGSANDYSGYYYSYKLSGYNVTLKFMFGPKNSTTEEVSHSDNLK